MQTVNFQCGHCGNLMAVGAEYVGQQVRCPHCQQVVLAPATDPPRPAAEAPPPPAFDAMRQEMGGLFGTPPEQAPPEPTSPLASMRQEMGGLFGTAAPALEPPSYSPPPEPVPESIPVTVVPVLEPAAPPAADDTLTYYPQPAAPAPEPPVPFGQAPAPGGWPAAEAAPEPLASAIPQPVIRAPRSRGWVIPLLIVPLISYAILATIAVVVLYNQKQAQTQKSPLEEMLDAIGDYPGANHVNPQSLFKRVKPDLDLPPHLRVGLGGTLQVGQLEVKPTRVELRPVRFLQGNGEPEASSERVLVLELQLTNTSQDVVFKPTDPYFERRWKREQGTPGTGNMPYMFLDLVKAKKRVYGGPVEWKPPKAGRFAEPRERVEGQKHGQDLPPGETLTTFVCTDPEDHVARDLARYDGPLVWRDQLRRGLVRVRDREVSTTAVVGVEFTDKDVAGLKQN
jgi:hypothetical protein